ncbi:General secretion pathway protein C [hydrothermal vent metagenome]|uniref:General secretion pathway protein C n=1 Tax=hydrothermal vent metagenome TaxID=652676 RepID=A0A1W1BTS7_9ZZZZ
MKHLFKPQIIKWVIVLFVLILVVKLMWLAVEVIYLPVSGINQAQDIEGKSLYYRVNLSPNKASSPKQTIQKMPVGNIKDIELLALYNAPNMTVVTVQYKGKTKVLSEGDNINGFVLEGAGSNYATFSKGSKMYRLNLIKGEPNDSSIQGTSSSINESSSTPEGEVTDAGDHKIVDKSLLEHYTNNLDDIYKNIGIADIKKNGQVTGFRVSFIKRGSPFAKLGLKRGDIIKSVNGQEINSYNSAFNVYKNMKNIQDLTLVIIRGKKEMELNYEIN